VRCAEEVRARDDHERDADEEDSDPADQQRPVATVMVVRRGLVGPNGAGDPGTIDLEAAADAILPRRRYLGPTPRTRLHTERVYWGSVSRVTRRPMVIAHRGASGYRPEHTAAAYQLAITQGADAVEPDLVSTGDGVLVIRHENQISGTTDVAAHPEFAARKTTKVVDGASLTGWFTEDFTWEELATLRCRERLGKTRPANTRFDGHERILRLSDLIDILDGAGRPVTMVAELKHPTYFAGIGLALENPFAQSVADWAKPDNLIVESFEQTVLGKVTELEVPGRVTFLAEAHGAPADQVAQFGSDARPFADYLTDAGLARLAAEVDGVSVDKALLLETDADGTVTGTTDLVARARSAGLETFTWTLRSENRFLAKNFRRGIRKRDTGDWRDEFELIMRTGVDGVFADQPDLAIQARAAL
jgi:glycerophosphoryl diester phosphodiesterase